MNLAVVEIKAFVPSRNFEKSKQFHLALGFEIPWTSEALAYVEDFQPRDTEALVRMWRASFEYGVGITDPHPLHEQVEYFQSKIVPIYRVRVVKLAGAIVGFLAANAASVAQLHVRVDNIGQGIGSRLIRLAQAESSGSLWLFAFVQNTRACRFYEHHGFVAVAYGSEPVWQLEDVKYQWVN